MAAVYFFAMQAYYRITSQLDIVGINEGGRISINKIMLLDKKEHVSKKRYGENKFLAQFSFTGSE